MRTESLIYTVAKHGYFASMLIKVNGRLLGVDETTKITEIYYQVLQRKRLP